MRKRPRFLRWDWITVFSGVLLMIAGALKGIATGQSPGMPLLTGFLIFCIGATLLLADY